MSWQHVKFGDFAEVQPQVILEKGAVYSFIEMADIEPHTKFVHTNGTRAWKGGGGAKFEDGDVIFARITPCLEHGKTAKVSDLTDAKGFGSTEFFVFRARENISDPDFIYYLSCSPTIRKPAIKSMRGTSGRQRAQRTVVENTTVRVPRLEEQRQIASILSTYDNLIKNNRRRIQLLEQAARLLYKEWFVHLRFPGHEHTKITNGVPEGWENKPLADLAKIKGGKQYGENSLNESWDFPVFGGNGIQGYSQKRTHSGFLIVFGRVGANCGSIHWSYGGAWVSNNASSIIPHSHNELVLQHLLHYNFTHLRKGSAQPFISNGILSTVKLLIPTDILASKFCSNIQNFRHQQRNLNYQIRLLAKARDLLLPRLMNENNYGANESAGFIHN